MPSSSCGRWGWTCEPLKEITKTRNGESTKDLGSQDDSLCDEDGRIEVEQQADSQAGGLQIRPELREVDVIEPLDGLDLHDDLAVHEQVEAMDSYVLFFEPNVHFVLPFEANATATERDWKCIFIDAFHRPRSQDPMNVDRRLEDPSRQHFELMTHSCFPFRAFELSWFRDFLIFYRLSR